MTAHKIQEGLNEKSSGHQSAQQLIAGERARYKVVVLELIVYDMEESISKRIKTSHTSTSFIQMKWLYYIICLLDFPTGFVWHCLYIHGQEKVFEHFEISWFLVKK